MSDLTLSATIKNSIVIIATSGYINNIGGEKIAQECYKYIDDGISKIVLDLKDSKVVNSIGISILIEIMEKLEDVAGKLVFINLDSAIEKTFSIMGLFQYAGKAGSIDDALNQLQG